MTIRYGSVCSGVEAASLAWIPLGWQCKFVAEVEPFPCAVLQERFGASAPIHPLDPEKASTEEDRKMRESWIRQNSLLKKEGKIPNEGDFTKIGTKYAGEIDLLVGGTPCFVAGTMVLTPSGYVPIETLKVGDSVISGDGIARKVEAVGHKTAEVGKISILGRPEIVCTGNHPFMCIDVKRDGRRESETYGNTIAVGEYKEVRADEAKGMYAGRIKVQKTDAPEFPVVYDATEEQIMELAGWYLGDGYIRSFTGKTKKAVILALVSEKKIDEFKEKFLGSINYSISSDGKVTICNTALANWLLENFGHLSHKKRVPYWVYSHKYKNALLNGYMHTDGSDVHGEYKFCTVSSALAYGIADLFENASVSFTKTPSTAIIDGRTVNQKDWYCVHQYKNKTIRTKKIHDRYASIVRGFTNAGTDTVYNITVAEDHTYIANGIWVHNCQDLSVAGKREGFDGERSSLALDFVRLAYESKCKWFVWENVPGVFSSNEGRDFATLLSLFTGCEVTVPRDGFGTAGFVCNTRRDRFGVAWRTLDGQFTRASGFSFAVPQRRRRVFVVGYFGDWRRAAEVLLEPGRMSWDTPTRFKARERVADFTAENLGMAIGALSGACKSSTDRHWDVSGINPTLNQSSAGSAIIGASNQELFSQNYNGLVTSIGNGQVDGLINEPEIGQTLNCMHDQQAIQIVTATGNDLAGTIDANYYKGVGSRTGEERTVICRATQQGNAETMENACPTITEAAGTSGNNQPIICLNDQGGAVMGVEDNGNSGTLRANTHGNEQIVCGEFVGCDLYNKSITGDVSKTLNSAASDADHVPTVLGDLVQTLKIRGGKEGGGKGALIQDNISATQGCGNDQSLFLINSTETAAFMGGQGAKAGGITYSEEFCPTLKSNAGGNTVPEVISCNSKKMGLDIGDELCGTLNATDYKEPQVVCYENHANDSRVQEMGDACQTISSRAGTGGGNLPLVQCFEWHSQDLRAKLITDNCGTTISAGMGMGGASNTTPMLVRECYVKTARPKFKGDCETYEDTGIAATLNTFDVGDKRANELIVYHVSFCDTNGTRSDRPNGGCYVTMADTGKTITAMGPNMETVVVQTNIIGLDGYNGMLTFDTSATLGVNCGISTGRNGVLTAMSINCQGGSAVNCGNERCDTITAASNSSGNNLLGVISAVAVAENIIGRQDHTGGNGVGAQEEIAYTQNATGVMGVCTKGNGDAFESEVHTSISASGGGQAGQGYPCARIHSTVRRLLPIETERLMGFPDNHTKIPWKGKSAEDCPDSPRYKACGNSMCVNVMRWIGEQIQRVENMKEENNESEI